MITILLLQGVNWAATTINVTTAASPFQVTAPNTAVTWTGNSSQNVTWNVASTTAAPVSCATVNIRLSTDGGYAYPVNLASGVSNNGTASISLPNISTTTARIQVACASNIFFDISNVNFTIVPGSADVALSQTITPSLITPNSLITYTLTVTNAGPSNSSTITVTDNLPTTGFNLGNAFGAGWACTSLSSIVTCTLPDLSANGLTTINITGTVTAATGTLTNTAWVTSTSDQVPGNNGPITLVTAITPGSADVALSQTITPSLVMPNSLITYTLTITNAGPSNSSIITVTDNLPTTGFNLGNAFGAGWACTSLSSIVTCTLPDLSANGLTIINITGTVTAPAGTLTNTAWVTSTIDPVPGNNGPITLVTAITPLVDQTITFDPLPDKTYGDPDFVITATASSGLPVSFDVGATDRCTNTASTIHLTGAGTCIITATQAGSGIYHPAVPVSHTFQINQAATTVLLASTSNPAVVLRPITFTAAVTSTAGTPTGIVQLYANGALFSDPIALSSGSATWVTNTLTIGTHTITATYRGAANYATSNGILVSGQVVEPIHLYLPIIWR